MNLVHLVLFSFFDGASEDTAVVVADVAGGYGAAAGYPKKRRFIIDGRRIYGTEDEARRLIKEAIAALEARSPEQSKPARKKALARVAALQKVAIGLAERDLVTERRLRAAQEDEELLLILFG